MHSVWSYLLAKQALYLLSYGPVFAATEYVVTYR
jgi:hypothetical protein